MFVKTHHSCVYWSILYQMSFDQIKATWLKCSKLRQIIEEVPVFNQRQSDQRWQRNTWGSVQTDNTESWSRIHQTNMLYFYINRLSKCIQEHAEIDLDAIP